MQRTSITLPQRSMASLDLRAAKDEITRSEALRRAIWVYTELRDREETGAHIVIYHVDGKEERLLLIS